MSNASSSLATPLLKRIPSWVGFGIILIIGVLAIIAGALAPSPGLIAIGVAAIASTIIAWRNGATSKPNVDFSTDPVTFGAIVENIDGWAWILVFVLFLAAVVIAVVFH